MLQSNTDEQVLACFPETQPSFLSPFAWTDPCSEPGSRLVHASAPAITLDLTMGTVTAADGRGWRHRRILTSQREFLVLTEKKKKKEESFFPLQYVMGISSSQSSGHSTSLSNWAGCWWALEEPPPPHTSSQGLPAGSWAWRGGPLSSPGCHTPAASGSNDPPQAHHRRSFSKRTEEPAQTFCSWARPAPLTSITSSHGNLIL